MVQQRSPGQIVTPDLNPHCNLDLEHSNPKSAHNTPARDDAPQYQVWLQKVQKFRRLFEDLSPHCDLDLEDRNPNFSHDTPAHEDAPTYQVFIKKG